jgi:hypothetical protein
VKKRERPRQFPNGDFLRLVPFSVGELDFQASAAFSAWQPADKNTSLNGNAGIGWRYEAVVKRSMPHVP